MSVLSIVPLLVARTVLAQEAPPQAEPAPSPAVLETVPLSSAAPQLPSRPPPVRYESQWYGWQIMIPDAVGVSLVAAGIGAQTSSTGSTALGIGALSVLSLDGPIIHLVHRRYGVAAASFGLRVGGAVLGAIIGGVAASGGGNQDADVPPGVVGAIFGFGIGAMAGMIADDAGLAWERVPVSTSPVASAQTFHLALAPIASPTQRGMGLVGTF